MLLFTSCRPWVPTRYHLLLRDTKIREFPLELSVNLAPREKGFGDDLHILDSCWLKLGQSWSVAGDARSVSYQAYCTNYNPACML